MSLAMVWPGIGASCCGELKHPQWLSVGKVQGADNSSHWRIMSDFCISALDRSVVVGTLVSNTPRNSHSSAQKNPAEVVQASLICDETSLCYKESH